MGTFVIIGIMAIVFACICGNYRGKKQEEMEINQLENVFHGLVKELNKLGEDIYEFQKQEKMRDNPLHQFEHASSRNWNDNKAPIYISLSYGNTFWKEYVCAYVSFKEIYVRGEGVSCAVSRICKSNFILFPIKKILKITDVCDVDFGRIKDIATQLHCAAELYRRNHFDLSKIAEKHDNRDNGLGDKEAYQGAIIEMSRMLLKSFSDEFRRLHLIRRKK